MTMSVSVCPSVVIRATRFTALNSCCHSPLTPTVQLPYGYSYKAPVHDQVMPPFVIFDIRTLWHSWLSFRVPGCQKLQITA